MSPKIAFRISNLKKSFRTPHALVDRLRGKPAATVRALNGINLSVMYGETMGIVGESGCGKSTLARCLVRLHQADAGTIEYGGVDIQKLRGEGLSQYNRKVQMIFQDPFSSLNPRMTVAQTLGEALRVHRMCPPKAINARIQELLELVGLPADAADRLPHEFSGGQRQRIGIARALAVEPECLVADELVSALDVSVQAQVINLLLELQERLNLTVLFVAHDLRLVRHISHRVAVMYLGSIVEIGETEALFQDPKHPYTQALLAAAPELDPDHKVAHEAVAGELPSPLNLPTGCPFHPRCPHAFHLCTTVTPQLALREGGRHNACHLYDLQDEEVAA